MFRIPLIARVVLVLASSVAPRAHAFSALTISAPSVPSGRGVRSTRPPDFFFSDPALAPAADSLPEDTGLSFQSFASLLPSLFSAAAASFLPHCAAAVSSPIASSFTSLITTSRGDVASSTGISAHLCVEYECSTKRVRGGRRVSRRRSRRERKTNGALRRGAEASRERRARRSRKKTKRRQQKRQTGGRWKERPKP